MKDYVFRCKCGVDVYTNNKRESRCTNCEMQYKQDRIKELEAENKKLKARIEIATNCFRDLAEDEELETENNNLKAAAQIAVDAGESLKRRIKELEEHIKVLELTIEHDKHDRNFEF